MAANEPLTHVYVPLPTWSWPAGHSSEHDEPLARFPPATQFPGTLGCGKTPGSLHGAAHGQESG
jgi:hypothetical protein